ncbi:hypothetical protein FB45DRAFT_898450 [Roridomyces roridus]|uniref:ENTH domain-containing protein n=1 Tax=Roridomyces roridus TaxID=1738132 RepID=A0AAD7CC00_9AGAR|nr:hypothetical protein FB45DRAFT_898450 [Roridomyces roridus]
MDRLEALGTSLSQITMYDIKSMYNQAKNVVLNVSEIEAKVREATNDDPWGASSTLMQDIANRTFNYPDFNEIMPSIYARFMEKEARQWRQIYKALQLLEYLIKNGSERVVDDARSHVSTIKMLRNFHYIDDKGKDEGVNVRNRSRELVELLSDVEKIRGERRKAKANKHKYIGTGNEGGMSFGGGGSGRYGGFGNDSGSYGGSGGGGVSDYYNSGGAGSSSSGSGGFRDDRRAGGGFDEYNAGDDEIGVTNSNTRDSGASRTSPTTRRAPERKATAPPPPPPPAPPVNLFDDDDDGSAFAAPAPAAPPATGKALPTPAIASPTAGGLLDDDDFADFQAAPTSPAPAPAPATNANAGLFALMNANPVVPTPAPMGMFGQQQQQQPRPGMGMGMGSGMGMGGGMAGMGHRANTSSISSPPLQPQSPNYTSMQQPAAPNYSGVGMTPMSAQGARPGQQQQGAVKPATPASANFDDLWSMSLGSKPATPAAGGGAAAGGKKSIKDLEKEKATAGLWGAKPPAGFNSASIGGSIGMGGMGGSSSSGSGGLDDLLG